MDQPVHAPEVESCLSNPDGASVAPVDHAVGPAERFALGMVRLWWSSATGAGPCPRVLVRNALIAANLPAAAHENFEEFMRVLMAAGRPRPAVRDARAATIGADETNLIHVIALCQQGHSGHAIMVLKQWLPPMAYRVGLKSLTVFARAMVDCGLHVRMQWPVTQH
jgi:hypothetical protein